MADKAPPQLVRAVLFTALDALSDYLDDVVIVGGWVPQIYGWIEESPEVPVHSYDVDAALDAAVPVRGRGSIAERMKAAGFEARTADANFALAAFGKKKPPVTQFFYRKGKLEVAVEFITPLAGRDENTPRTVQAGLVIPALRFTEILLRHPRTVSLTGETLDGTKKKFTFKIPSLSAFVYSKGLIFVRRESDKMGKDLAYIYETLKRPAWREEVLKGLPDVVAAHPSGWYQTFKRNLQRAFETEGAFGPAMIAREAPSRP